MAISPYTKLTRKRRTLLGYTQLWQGPDHLLLLKSTRFQEHYRRFLFRDIHAIRVAEVPSPNALRIVWLVIVALWILGSLQIPWLWLQIVGLASGGLGIAALTIDLLRGPRCRCVLVTAVSREELAPVSRIAIARRFLARIRPAIESVQGRIDDVERLTTSPPAARPSAAGPPEVPKQLGRLMELLFALLAANAAVILALQTTGRWDLYGVGLTAFLGEVVAAILVLKRRPPHDPRRFAYAVVIVAMVLLTAEGLFGAGYGILLIAEIFEAIRTREPAPKFEQPHWFQASVIFSISWRAALATIGSAALLWPKFRRRAG